jgi:undecaprenyl-diphosphatase
MNILKAIILGATQGFTEFLPISSSGHLLLVRDLLGLSLKNTLTFDAVLQMASVFAVVIYFFQDLKKIFFSFIKMLRVKPVENDDKKMVLAILWGTIPAVVFGLLLESKMDSVFRDVRLVAAALIFGSLLMYFAQIYSTNKEEGDNVTAKKGLILGFFQSLALLPGVSRSGATISGGLFLGLSRQSATRFSFLLSVPILLGSGLKKVSEINIKAFPLDLVVGFVVSFIVSLLSIHFLLKFIKNHNLNIFIIYRLILAFSILLIV